MSLWGIIFIIAAAALFAFLIAPALLVFFAVFSRKKAVPFEQYDLKKFQDHYYLPYLGRIAEAREFLQAKPHREVSVTSRDGLRLYGEYYSQGADRTAILFHGIGAEMYTNLSSQARLLYESGFNVLLTCQRAHGKSEGRWTTIGLREQYDVLKWTRWAEQHGGKQILLYGVSMGAAAVAYASDKLQSTNVRAVVIDSGFYSIHEQMRRDANKNHIPKIMIPAQWVLTRLFLRVDIKTPVTEALQHAAVPVFFLHGTDDETVESRWAEENYRVCSPPKELFLAEGAPHTLSVLACPEPVKERLQAFFCQYFD